MITLFINRYSKTKQLLISLFLISLISGVCFGLSNYLNYHVVSFILLVAVSLTAMSFDIIPVLITSFASALIWDYFFIPPHFTLHVGSTEDRILLLMYLVIALVNAVLTYKIRQIEKVAMIKEEKTNTLKLYNTILNSLSHELRTPIAAIIGATDNLQTLNGKLTEKNKGEILMEISRASFRLNQQVENLLNMSRLESGFVEPKKDWTDISECIYGVVQSIEENKVSQTFNININPAIPFFKLDKVMLEQIVYNILHNAVRYTHEKSRIEITATCHADVLHIEIDDDGPGFPEDELDKVFDRFYRLKHSKIGGTGLGLSIVKGFTEALGGVVHLKNNSKGGAKFIIDIQAETSQVNYLPNE